MAHAWSHCFFKESLEEAVRRVAKKELGLNLFSIKFLDFVEYHQKDYMYGGKNHHAVSLVFVAEAGSDNVVLNDEASEFIITKKIPKGTLDFHTIFLKKHPEVFK